MSEKTVFISYRRDATGKAFARSLKQELKHQGYDVFMDVDDMDSGQWEAQILAEVPKRAHFLLLLTPSALDRCTDENDWVRREFLLAFQHGRNIVPICEESVTLATMSAASPECMKEVFSYQIASIRHGSFESNIQTLISRYIPPHQAPKEAEIQPSVDIFHLPKPTTALIGRKTELAQLTTAFTDPNKRLAIIVAAGGIGKSALTDEWLQQIAVHNYYGKTHVFGWSFYSQGSHNTFTNSQPFFSAVLPFLGISEIPKDEIEKARVLAQCLQQQPCLLILDGLEPLQYAENLPSMSGELQDSALKEFIACLRRTADKSFVLLSSRQPLMELKNWQPESYLSLDLKTLPPEDGAALLKNLGVTGEAEERQAICKDLNGHALSLVLLGHLLHEHHQGDCRYAKELPPLTSAHGDSNAEQDSRHALRVLDYYDSLQDEASRCFLQLLGLFDRPMNPAEKAVLIASANHAEPLRALTQKQWQAVEQRLERSGLLLGRKGTFTRFEWDTHPIIRAYFGQKFKENHPETFKQAHKVLFDYYQNLPEKEVPDTLEEMLPLYRAVMHGCLAGEYKKALIDVFQQRINRINDLYSLYKLGAYSYNLVALSAFFSANWIKLNDEYITEPEEVWLSNLVSFSLMSSGRLLDAVAMRERSIELSLKMKDLDAAASNARTFTDLLLPLGKLREAEIVSNKSLSYALQIYDKWGQKRSYSRVAIILYHLGKLDLAKITFIKSEQIQAQSNDDPSFNFLYASRYCGLLIDMAGNHTDFENILNYILKCCQSNPSLLDVALNHLTLARIFMALQYHTANIEFNLAVQGIQKANKIEFTPPFYLYRADFYSLITLKMVDW